MGLDTTATLFTATQHPVRRTGPYPIVRDNTLFRHLRLHSMQSLQMHSQQKKPIPYHRVAPIVAVVMAYSIGKQVSFQQQHHKLSPSK
jgi:hypothetical protein